MTLISHKRLRSSLDPVEGILNQKFDQDFFLKIAIPF